MFTLSLGERKFSNVFLKSNIVIKKLKKNYDLIAVLKKKKSIFCFLLPDIDGLNWRPRVQVNLILL